jgi:peptidoglycan hydrolase-like protein with peptidoglycan-binding domain
MFKITNKQILILVLNILLISALVAFLNFQTRNKKISLQENSVAAYAEAGYQNINTANSVDSTQKTEEPYFFNGGFLTQNLSLNSKGDEVKLLQTLLIKSGDLNSSVIPNGYFGPSTKKAVQTYQVRNGIVILNKKSSATSLEYGKVGAITRASLNSQYGNKMEGVTWVAGKYGSGVSLNGGYIEIPTSTDLDITYKDGVMFDAWINPSILLKSKETIFSRGNHYGLGITEQGKVFVRQDGRDIVSSKRYVKVNEWQHVSATLLGGKIIFKYNDKQVEVKSYKTRVVVPGNDPLLVGVSFDPKKGYGESYIGALDNVYVYTVPSKELAPLPKIRLNLDDAEGGGTVSLTGKYKGELKVVIGDKELLKNRIPETKVPELVPPKKKEESKYPETVEKVVDVVQNVIQQYTGISLGGGGGSSSSEPAPALWSGTPPDPNFPMPPRGQEIAYSVSSRAETPVKFTEVIINPLSVYPGDTQTLTAKVTSTAGTISSVQSVTQLDTSTKTLNFTDDGTGTNTWIASWVVSDTHVNIYKTTFTATDSAGNSANTYLTWSDPCSDLLAATNSALSSLCSISSLVEGVDDGNVTINLGGTLQINTGATFVINQGKSITNNRGTITIAKGVGASMTKGFLYYPDADSDGYPSAVGTVNKSYNSNQTTTGKVRIKDVVALSRTVDPSDSDATIKKTLTCYKDLDLDSYTDPVGAVAISGGDTCEAAFTGVVANKYKTSASASKDCDDSTNTIVPGTTRAGYTTANPACGSTCAASTQTQTCQTTGVWNGSGVQSCTNPTTPTWYKDQDGDGYYSASYPPVTQCNSPGTYYSTTVKTAGDCSDTVPSIYAGTTRAGYTVGSVACGSLCSSVAQTQTCQSNSTWSGSGITSCTVDSCCDPNMGNSCGTCDNGTIQCNGSCVGGSYNYAAATCGTCDNANIDRCTGVCDGPGSYNYAAGSCGLCDNASIDRCTGGCDGPGSYNYPGGSCGTCDNASLDRCTNICDGPGSYNYAAGSCGTCNNGSVDRCSGGCSGDYPNFTTSACNCNNCGCGGSIDECSGVCSGNEPENPASCAGPNEIQCCSGWCTEVFPFYGTCMAS